MKLLKMPLALIIISGNLYAQDIRVAGTISHTLKLPSVESATQNKRQLRSAPAKFQQIKLLKMELSAKAQANLANKARKAIARSTTSSDFTEKFPSKIQLTMNGVPVLNQGNHGSCAVFAITAAIDAVLNKGDYVSQLCQLQLGNYLAKNGYTPSGWDGSIGRIVLSQMDETGFVNKQQQMEQGCGGLTEYPLNEEDPETQITLDEFHQISEPLDSDMVSWWTLLDVFDVTTQRIDTNQTLAEVKTALGEGDRVVTGVLLLDFDLGLMGAVGKKGTTYDSWVLTPEIARDVYLRPDLGGHELVITGYDDNAVAIDDKGRAHRGLLTLRNSWGESAGDHGNFYMSYDYFKLFVIEAQRIHNEIDDEMAYPDDGV